MTDAKGVVLPITDDMPDWHKRLREHLNLLGNEDIPAWKDLKLARVVEAWCELKFPGNRRRFAHLSATLRDDNGNLSDEGLSRLVAELKARADAAGVRL